MRLCNKETLQKKLQKNNGSISKKHFKWPTKKGKVKEVKKEQKIKKGKKEIKEKRRKNV